MQHTVQSSNNLVNEYVSNTSPNNENSYLETSDPFLNNNISSSSSPTCHDMYINKVEGNHLNNSDNIISNKDVISKQDLKKMIEDKKIYQQQINNFYNLIDHNKKLIKDLEKTIYNNCSHEWIRDECANFDDRCKHICSKCSLYRSEYMYR